MLYFLECTFIILDKINYDECNDEVKSMVGDTNIFLKEENGAVIGEIEIMIAEICARGKGLGKEAVLLMLRYGNFFYKFFKELLNNAYCGLLNIHICLISRK